MKSRLVVVYCLILTGFVCYLSAIFHSLGIDDEKVVSPFFDSRDLFADYIKHIGSFGLVSSFRIEGWLPRVWQDIFNSYLSNNPYSSDPSFAGSSLTHFHAPPLVIILARGIIVPLFTHVGVATSYLLAASILVVSSLVLITSCFDRPSDKLFMGPAVLLLYPCVFAFTRGNLYAMLSSLFVISSFLLIARRSRYWFLAVLLMCLSIGLRPNSIVLLPFLCIFCKRIYGIAVPRIRFMISSALFCLASTGILSLAIANRVYPVYTLDLFTKGYSFYQKAYEYGKQGADYSSSLLQPLKLLVIGLNQTLPDSMNSTLLPVISRLCLVLGILVSIYSYRCLLRRGTNIARSLFVCIVGMILATPVFTDYHLTILIAPILLAACFERSDLNEVSRKMVGSEGSLPLIDSIALILLLTPKSFPLFPLGITAQTFFNPMIIAGYLVAILARQYHFRLRPDE